MLVVADLYDSTLCEGFIPPLLKSAIVPSLPKLTPPKCIEDDVRPISLTCQLAKVLEGFTLARVYPSIVGNLDRNQFAVAGKSTEQALVYLLHLALEALDSGGCYLRLFIADFKTGFDLIDHLILMEKLSTSTISTGACLGGSHLFCKGGLRSQALAPRFLLLYI